MLGVGEKFPHFVLLASVSANNRAAVRSISDQDLRGQWLVYFFWPKDFTELSLSEIVDFGALIAEFRERNAQLVGCSVESELSHRGWRNQEEALGDLAFPMLADVKRELCGQLGILDEEEGVAQRATFIVDPSGVICFVYATTSDVSRDPGEVLRILADLQDRKYRARN